MSLDSYIQQYLASMKHICSEIKDEYLTDFSKTLFVKELAAKERIFDVNNIQEHLVFINKGLARSFYISENGDEITNQFAGENEFLSDYPAFLSRKPSQYVFETIEPTIGVYLSKSAIDEGYKIDASLQKYGRLVAEAIVSMKQDRLESFLFKSAKERYLDILNDSRDIVNRVPQRHLASYIGIERQSLSRIRKQILTENDT